MRSSLTQRAYLKWRRYWDEEPWGPVRDNMHAAVIAREIRRPQLKPGARLNLDDFMIRRPEARAKERNAGMLTFLRSVAKKTGKEGGGD